MTSLFSCCDVAFHCNNISVQKVLTFFEERVEKFEELIFRPGRYIVRNDQTENQSHSVFNSEMGPT